MSYSSFSQGLQSCLEPKLIESPILRLKLAPPRSNSNKKSSHSEYPNISTSSTNATSFSNFEAFDKNPISQNNTKVEHDMKRVTKDSSEPWSFIQSLSNISYSNNKTHDWNVYVHPKVKCSSTMLSAKSLEMCTESLGCETGISTTTSNASEISDEISLFSLENDSTSFNRNNNTIQVSTNKGSKRLNRTNTSNTSSTSFPPPLTSITDFGGVQVRPHREDGRLILEAVTTTSFRSYFHVERRDGRLRLRLFESVAAFCCGDEDEVAYEEQEQEEFEEGKIKNEACDEEEIGSKEELEKYEMEMTKFTTPSRCKESGRNRDIFCDGYFELPSLSLCL